MLSPRLSVRELQYARNNQHKRQVDEEADERIVIVMNDIQEKEDTKITKITGEKKLMAHDSLVCKI